MKTVFAMIGVFAILYWYGIVTIPMLDEQVKEKVCPKNYVRPMPSGGYFQRSLTPLRPRVLDEDTSHKKSLAK